MNLNLSIPTISHLQKVPREQVYAFANDLIQAWHEGQLRAGIDRMCEKTYRNPDVEMDFFKNPNDKSINVCICKGFRKNVKNGSGKIKCHRKAKPGTNYCGYHQGQAPRVVPPRRVPMPVPERNVMPHYTSSVVAPHISVLPPDEELIMD